MWPAESILKNLVRQPTIGGMDYQLDIERNEKLLTISVTSTQSAWPNLLRLLTSMEFRWIPAERLKRLQDDVEIAVVKAMGEDWKREMRVWREAGDLGHYDE